MAPELQCRRTVVNTSSKRNLIRLVLTNLVNQETLRPRKPSAPVMLLMALRSRAARTQTPQKRLTLEVSVAPEETQSVQIRHLGR